MTLRDMRSFDTAVDIAAAPDAVWAVLADVERWPEWTPTVVRIARIDGEPLAVGSRYRIEQPRLKPAIWTVSSCEPGVAFTWVSRSPGVAARGAHRIERRADRRCTVALAVDFSGPLAPLAALVAGRLTRQYIATEARSLKHHCERPE